MEIFFVVIVWEERGATGLVGMNQACCLNLLQCSGCPFPSKTAGYHLLSKESYLVQNVNSAEIENHFVDIPSLRFSDM